MKSIALSPNTKFPTAEVLRQIVETASNDKGVTVAEMRRRFRLLDAIDAAGGSATLLLEDADHAFLNSLMDGFRFAIVHKDLVAIHEAVEKAKTVQSADAVAPEGEAST